MRRNALTRALTALLAVGLLATTLPPGPALGYQSDRPRQLAMETENRLARAENTPDLELAIAAYRDILHNMDLIVADHPDSEQAATIRAGKPLRGQELLVRARIETRLANAERQYNVGPCFEQPAADCLLDLTVDFAGFKPETRDQVTLDPGEADLRDLVLIRLVAAQARAGLADRALALLEQGLALDPADPDRILLRTARPLTEASKATAIASHAEIRLEAASGQVSPAKLATELTVAQIFARSDQSGRAKTIFYRAMATASELPAAEVDEEAVARAQADVAVALARAGEIAEATRFATAIRDPAERLRARLLAADHGYVQAEADDGRRAAFALVRGALAPFEAEPDLIAETLATGARGGGAARVRRHLEAARALYRLGRGDAAKKSTEALLEIALALDETHQQFPAMLAGWRTAAAVGQRGGLGEWMKEAEDVARELVDSRAVIAWRYMVTGYFLDNDERNARMALQRALTRAAELREDTAMRFLAWTSLAEYYLLRS